MVQIAGKYEFVSSENYKEYLMSLGANEEQASKQASIKPTVEVSNVGASEATVGALGTTVTFPFNKEIEHNLLVGTPVKTTLILNDDGFTFKTKFEPSGTVSEEKVWKFTDAGFVSTSTNHKGVKAVVHFKRV